MVQIALRERARDNANRPFGIVLISCSIVYYKTKKTLNKYEKEFLTELETLTAAQKKSVLEKSKITSQILVTSSKSN